MITLGFQPSREARAELSVFPLNPTSGGFIALTILDGKHRVNLFGSLADRERFEQITALLNESFAARRPARPAVCETPAELAGDYLGVL